MSSIPHAFRIFHSQTDMQKTGAVRNFRYRQHPLSIHYHLHLKVLIKFCRCHNNTNFFSLSTFFSGNFFHYPSKKHYGKHSSHKLCHPEGLPDTGCPLKTAEQKCQWKKHDQIPDQRDQKRFHSFSQPFKNTGNRHGHTGKDKPCLLYTSPSPRD